MLKSFISPRITFALMALLISSCSLDLQREPEIEKIGNIELSIPTAPVSSIVARIEGNLQGPLGLNRDFSFSISNDTARAVIERLITGQWSLTVNAYDSDGNKRFSGSTTVVVEAGIQKVVNLVMNAETGSLLIQVTWNFEPTGSSSSKIVHLDFDGTTSDKSGNGYHATSYGGAFAPDRNGNPAGAYALDGVDDYLSFGINKAFHISGPMTVAAWIKIATDAFAPHILQTSFVENTNTGSIFFFNQDRLAGITLGDGKAIGVNSRKSFHTNSGVRYGEWIHVVFVKRTATDMEIYINGQLQPGFYSGNGDGLVYNPNGETLIGKSDISNYTDDGFHFTKATFDELTVYSKALSNSEVQSIYEN
jgi:hypothetical protein